jgi:hypothetical protein
MYYHPENREILVLEPHNLMGGKGLLETLRCNKTRPPRCPDLHLESILAVSCRSFKCVY